jgi:hypothetical protein
MAEKPQHMKSARSAGTAKKAGIACCENKLRREIKQ